MIVEHTVNGSQDTTYHNLTITTNGMDIQISGGEYWRGGQILFSDTNGGVATIPTTPDTSYQVVLIPNNGIDIFQYTDSRDLAAYFRNNQTIDTIAWFTVGTNVTSLDTVEINVVKMVVV